MDILGMGKTRLRLRLLRYRESIRKLGVVYLTLGENGYRIEFSKFFCDADRSFSSLPW